MSQSRWIAGWLEVKKHILKEDSVETKMIAYSSAGKQRFYQKAARKLVETKIARVTEPKAGISKGSACSRRKIEE